MLRVAVGGAAAVTVLVAATAVAWHVLDDRVLALADALPSEAPARGVPLEFDRALTGLSAVGLLCCLLWLSLTSAAVVLDALLAAGGPTRAPRRTRVTATVGQLASRCPATLRRLLLIGCGAAVAAGLVPAAATADPVGAAEPPRVTGSALVTGLVLPDRTVDATATDRGEAAHVVQAGDNLWSIAAGHLHPNATDASIAACWRAIHRHNRGVIGSDPDLIHPGTALRIPTDIPGAVPEEREESP